jgi:hypothetical protein
MADLVYADTGPLNLRLGGLPDGYTLADATVIFGAKRGSQTVTRTAAPVDDTTVSVLPDLGPGVWQVELEASWPDGLRLTFPTKAPKLLRVRPDIVPNDGGS